MIIINADDFGLNHGVNLAVLRAFELGLCSSCTIMPNMPGFEEACEIVRVRRLQHHVGLHLVLTEGLPVTERMRACPMFCDGQGRFRVTRRQRLIALSAETKAALQGEIEGQIARCREHGIPLTHLDSHSHVHEEWAVASAVIETATRAGVPHVRLARFCPSGRLSLRHWYRRVINCRLRAAGLAATQYFGAPDEYRSFLRTAGAGDGDATWEIMIHPVFNDQQQLIDGWLGHPLESLVTALDEYPTAVSYTRHRYVRDERLSAQSAGSFDP